MKKTDIKKEPKSRKYILSGPAKSGRWYLAGKGYMHESEMRGRRKD